MDFVTIASGNEFLWLAMLLSNFLGILVAFRFLGRSGLYVWIAMAAVIANIQVSKTVELFGFTATLGNIVYATSFLATDILSERYGKRAARRGVFVGFFAILVMTGLMQLAIIFEPAPSDTLHQSLAAVFGLLPRIAGASILAYLISQAHDVWAYNYWRKRVPGRMWLRNNLSTIVSQFIDSIVFTLAAFLGTFPTGVLVQIVVTTYLFKAVVAIVDTPFLYLAVRLGPRGAIVAVERGEEPGIPGRGGATEASGAPETDTSSDSEADGRRDPSS